MSSAGQEALSVTPHPIIPQLLMQKPSAPPNHMQFDPSLFVVEVQAEQAHWPSVEHFDASASEASIDAHWAADASCKLTSVLAAFEAE